MASKYKITAKSLSDWKRQFLQNASLAFDVGGATKAYKEEIESLKEENDALAKKLGKTTIERDWAVGKLKSLDLSNKRSLVDSKLSELSVTRQCTLIGLNRSTLYYEPKPLSAYELEIMNPVSTRSIRTSRRLMATDSCTNRCLKRATVSESTK